MKKEKKKYKEKKKDKKKKKCSNCNKCKHKVESGSSYISYDGPPVDVMYV